MNFIHQSYNCEPLHRRPLACCVWVIFSFYGVCFHTGLRYFKNKRSVDFEFDVGYAWFKLFESKCEIM